MADFARIALRAAKVAVAVEGAKYVAEGTRRLRNASRAAIGSGLKSLDEYTKKVKAR